MLAGPDASVEFTIFRARVPPATRTGISDCPAHAHCQLEAQIEFYELTIQPLM